jgi:hypothetical protein
MNCQASIFPYQETAPVTPLFSVGIKLAQFFFAFGLDAGQLGYSLKRRGICSPDNSFTPSMTARISLISA